MHTLSLGGTKAFFYAVLQGGLAGSSWSYRQMVGGPSCIDSRLMFFAAAS